MVASWVDSCSWRTDAVTLRLCALVVLAGCGGLYSTVGGGGGGTEQGTGGGDQQGTGGSGGLGFGGGYGGGLGTFRVGDGGFTFQDITPPINPSPTYERITGRSLTDVVLADGFGEIQHFDGNAWTVWLQLEGGPSFSGLYMAPTGDIFASGANQSIYWCHSDCSMSASWHSDPHSGISFAGLCGSGMTVYAVGHADTDQAGVVFKYQSLSDDWEQLSGANFASDYDACAIGGDGTLFIAGLRYVVEVSPQGMAKQVDLTGPQILAGLNEWRAITLMGTEVVIVGDEKRVARRNPAGQWTLLLENPNVDSAPWNAVQSVRAGEALLGGSGGDNIVNVGTMGLVDETSVVTTFDAPHDFELRDMWLADEHTVFIVGLGNALEGPQTEVVYRATR